MAVPAAAKPANKTNKVPVGRSKSSAAASGGGASMLTAANLAKLAEQYRAKSKDEGLPAKPDT